MTNKAFRYTTLLLVHITFAHMNSLQSLPAPILDVLHSYHNQEELIRYFSGTTIEQLAHSWKQRSNMLSGLLVMDYSTDDLITLLQAHAALSAGYAYHLDRLLQTSARVGTQELLTLSQAERAWITKLAQSTPEEIFGYSTNLMQKLKKSPTTQRAATQLRTNIESYHTRIQTMLRSREQRARKEATTAQLLAQALSALNAPF